MLAARGDPTLVKEFEDQLKARWNISQSEPLSSFLGINIHYNRAKGILTFDVEDKIKALFEEREWLSGTFIDGRNSPSQTPSNMGETISLDDYTTLPGKSGATHSISLCIATTRTCITRRPGQLASELEGY